MMFAFRKKALCFLYLLSIALLASCGSTDSTPAVPRFEKTACNHPLAPDSTTECGFLVVPEDRSNPNGKTIKLYVGIFKNAGGAASDEPVVYLTGGPGASTAGAYSIFENTSFYIRQNLGDNRDIIVLDQRGTNSSTPALYCSDELGPLRNEVYGISYRAAADLRIEALEKCYDRLKKQGINVSAYDTLENAADVKALRDVLGYGKVNLYSASYGTRLAMAVMKHHPEIIKSVVLDSILPPEINPFEQETPGILFSFRSFFDAAQAKYPALETSFYTMVDNLENNPVNVTGHHYDGSGNPIDNITVNVTGDKLIDYLVAQLKQTPYDKGLPQKIDAMFRTGDYTVAADSWLGTIDFFFPTGGAGTDAPSIGMFNSVFAAQDAYYTSPERIKQVISQYVTNPSLASWLETHFIYAEPQILGLWPVETIPYRESDPLVSDIPTLMLAGTLDNATPTIFSQPSSSYLSNSFYFGILAGHSTAYLECVDQMINNFYKNPAAEPVNACSSTYDWL